MSKLRLAVGQISSESNCFVSAPCALDFFRTSGYLLEGEALSGLRGTATEVAGILATLAGVDGIEVVPLLAARGNSSGPLSEACYSYLKENLLEALRRNGPVDGLILSHHGSMVALGEDDTEGDIAQSARATVGWKVPLVMTLDLHANVTSRMVQATNAMVAYERYPHDDVYSTGVRGAQLLLRAARGEIRPVIGHAKLPMWVTPFHTGTISGATFAPLREEAKVLERVPGVLSTSVCSMGSWLDVPDMGCSTLVVTDGDQALAKAKARELAEKFWALRRECEVETFSIAEAVRLGRKIDSGPVLLLDTADTTGGGASGDGIGLVKGLLDAGVTEPCLAMVVDPDAAKACAEAGAGSRVSLQIGHKLDPVWGQPIGVTGNVLRISDGRFQYTGGFLGGRWTNMGPSAVLEVGSVQILIMTYPTYDWADEQYRCLGMRPEVAKFVGVKNMMNFRFGYRDIMKGFFVLDVPGPTPPDIRSHKLKRVTRPLFPLDESQGDPDIQISTSGRS